MFEQDTICAVSTPPGESGIGIIRMSGMAAIEIAWKLFRPKRNGDIRAAGSRSLHYGHIVDPSSGDRVDEVLLSLMRAPATYTREDVVEINCHGGTAPLRRTMELLIASGARQAGPGEFTKRAFLSGRIDLAQAEAVMDVIRAKTDAGLRAANEQLSGGLSREVTAIRDRLIGFVAGVEANIDFPEEELDLPSGKPLAGELNELIKSIDDLLAGALYGRMIREGYAIAIIGRPNVGKSSLLNALLLQDRAIVTEIPGTTRDVLEEYLNISGMPVRILDTAGIRHTRDVVEQEGVRRSLAAMRSADIVLVVLDGSAPLSEEDRKILDDMKGKTAIAVMNKSDLPSKIEAIAWLEIQVRISCKTREGLDRLKAAITDTMQKGAMPPREHAWAVNQRHKTALEQTRVSLEKTLGSLRSNMSPEFVAIDLRDALDSIGSIIGATYTEDILERIFNDFCIGK